MNRNEYGPKHQWSPLEGFGTQAVTNIGVLYDLINALS